MLAAAQRQVLPSVTKYVRDIVFVPHVRASCARALLLQNTGVMRYPSTIEVAGGAARGWNSFSNSWKVRCNFVQKHSFIARLCKCFCTWDDNQKHLASGTNVGTANTQ